MSPIFIVGAPRSGTSLLRVMLNRHSLIGICDETYYFYYVYTRRRAFGDISDAKLRQILVDKYLATYRIRRLGLDLNALSKALIEKGATYQSFFDVLMQFYAKENGKVLYGEKTPQHALSSEVLVDWFPDCRLLHIVRDPRDVVASLSRMPWGGTLLGNTRIWLRHTLAAHHCSHLDNYLLIRYERLVTGPEEELRRICQFLEVDYESFMTKADNQEKSDRWWFERAHTRITTDRVEKWKKQLDPQEIAIIERIAGKHMSLLGYEPTGRRTSSASLSNAFFREALASFRRKFRSWPRLWYYWIQPTNLAAEEAWIDSNT